MKEKKIDYEQLYYDELHKNKKILKKIKDLEEEIIILKKYSNNGDLKEIIIKEIIERKK